MLSTPHGVLETIDYIAQAFDLIGLSTPHGVLETSLTFFQFLFPNSLNLSTPHGVLET